MVVFFNRLTGVAVPVEGVYQVVVEFFIKRLYPTAVWQMDVILEKSSFLVSSSTVL